MLQAHPVAAGNAADRLVVLEGDLHAVHGHVVEDDQIDQRGQNQHIEPAVIHHRAAPLVQSLAPGGRSVQRLLDEVGEGAE